MLKLILRTSNATFTLADLTTRYLTKRFRKVFLCCEGHIENLFKITGMKFEISNLEIRFHKRTVGVRVVETLL